MQKSNERNVADDIFLPQPAGTSNQPKPSTVYDSESPWEKLISAADAVFALTGMQPQSGEWPTELLDIIHPLRRQYTEAKAEIDEIWEVHKAAEADQNNQTIVAN